jgi:hypothetical protein
MGRAQRLASPIAGDLWPRMMPRWQMPNRPREASKQVVSRAADSVAGLVVQVGRGDVISKVRAACADSGPLYW